MTRDPMANLGILLGQVRKAWKNPLLGLDWDGGWYITTPSGNPLYDHEEVVFPTELEALNMALKLAPP